MVTGVTSLGRSTVEWNEDLASGVGWGVVQKFTTSDSHSPSTYLSGRHLLFFRGFLVEHISVLVPTTTGGREEGGREGGREGGGGREGSSIAHMCARGIIM